MVPLVFKTSLGVVRSPEGSTPSLLRQENSDRSSASNLPFRAVTHRLAQNRMIEKSRVSGVRFAAG